MSVHLEWLGDRVYQARFYAEEDGEQAYAQKLPFKAVATLLWYGDAVWVSGLLGEFNRGFRQDLASALLEKGAHTAFAMRRGEFREWDLLKELDRERAKQ